MRDSNTPLNAHRQSDKSVSATIWLSRIKAHIATMAVAMVFCLGVAVSSAPAQAQIFPESDFLEGIKDKDATVVSGSLISGGNPNERTKFGKPALVLAAEIGDPKIFQLLLDRGANIDLTDRKTGATPLMQAVSNNHRAIVKILLESKADVDREDKTGEPPLIRAVQRNNVDMVKLLIDGGADVNYADYTGRTALAYAVDSRNNNIVKILRTAGGTP